MAVVVQRMVHAHCAGVLFTCDPASGDSRKLRITANYGLGESVVSATVDPDVIVVRRDAAGHMHVAEKTSGDNPQLRLDMALLCFKLGQLDKADATKSFLGNYELAAKL